MRKFGPIKGIGYNATRFGAIFQEWNDRIRADKYQKPPDFVNTQQYFAHGPSTADINKVSRR